MPRTQTFSPSEFFIACGNDRHERGKARERAGEDALELQHAALVEDHRVEDRPARARRARGTTRWRATGKAGVVLAARQPLFLHGADRHAVDDERGRRVVVMRGDAEDLHVSTGSSANRARCLRWACHPSRLAPCGAPGQPREGRQQRRSTCSVSTTVPITLGQRRRHAAGSASTAGSRAPARPCRRYDLRRDASELRVRVVHMKHFVAEDLSKIARVDGSSCDDVAIDRRTGRRRLFPRRGGRRAARCVGFAVDLEVVEPVAAGERRCSLEQPVGSVAWGGGAPRRARRNRSP